MKIKRFIGGNLESNGYVIYEKEGGSCYVIDPGYVPQVFLEHIKEKQLKLQGILLTHNHYDHVGGVEKIRKTLGCPVMLHMEDVDQYGRQVDQMLQDGDQLMLGQEAIEVVHTPGHTSGSVCFYLPQSKVAFTGDTVFNVDLGRTDFANGSEHQMRESCHRINETWSNEVFIYPGHGDGCNMKTVRRINREFLDMLASS